MIQKYKPQQPISKICLICGINFLDISRSKNAKYCSKKCNTKASHMRYNLKNKQYKDKRDRKKYRYKRYRDDINFKLATNLRSRLANAIKYGQKAGSAIDDLGCSIEELKLYLESKFLPGMSWDNWSLKGWHIDHIIPLASFDLTDKEQLMKACHYTNLQPLWAKDNLKKNNLISH